MERERCENVEAKPEGKASARQGEAAIIQLEKPYERHETLSSLDIQLVQSLVERCLQLYLNQREVVQILHEQAKIEPGFTGLVWQKLEEQNPDFFQAYYARLTVKEQLVTFNQFVAKHHCILHGVPNLWNKRQQQQQQQQKKMETQKFKSVAS